MANKAWRIKKEFLSSDGCFARGGGIEEGEEFDPANQPEPETEQPPQLDVMQASFGQAPMMSPAQMPDTLAADTMQTNYNAQQAALPAAPGQDAPVPPDMPAMQQGQQSMPGAPAPGMSGMDRYMRGAQADANAQGKAATAQAEAYKQQVEGMQKFQDAFQDNMQQHTAQVDAIVQGMQNQSIDPDHFINSSSTGGKVGLAIGLMLGGLGQGLAQQKENPVMGIIQQRIKDDINAQIENRKGKENLLSTLEKQYGNKQDAVRMMSAAYTAQMAAKISEAAARSGSPIAQARAQMLIGQLQMQKDQAIAATSQAATARQMVMDGRMSQAEAIQHVVPEKLQKDAYKEAGEAEVFYRTGQQLDSSMKRMAELQSPAYRMMHPVDSKRELDALATQVNGQAKEIFGRVNETELDLLKGNLVKLGDSPENVARKIKIIKDIALKHDVTPILDGHQIGNQQLRAREQQSQPGSAKPIRFKAK